MNSPQRYDEAPSPTGFGYSLHHVQLCIPAGGEAKARRFYIDLLGLREVAKPPALASRGGMWLRADHIEVHLGADSNFQPATRAHPGIVVTDIDSLARRFTQFGYEPHWDDNVPGVRRFHVFDCFGNRLEFLTREPRD